MTVTLTAVNDPRPLTTEPLSLDLSTPSGSRTACAATCLPSGRGRAVAARRRACRRARPTAPALREARAAIRAAAADPADISALNAVLAHGRWLERLGDGGPERVLEVDDERWRVPWLAAQNLLELLRAGPDRIRRCANSACILHFYDASRGGRRQWCSMAACGNRAKARRHYERTREQD